MSAALSGGRRHARTPQLAAKVPIAAPQALGPESNPWFWNPGLFGIQFAPDWFRTRLHAMDPDVEVVWNRETERWQAFTRSTRVNHPTCRGWLLLFVVQDDKKQYVPLDERTLAKFYAISRERWGSGEQYFDAIVREDARDRAKREEADRQETDYIAGDMFNHAQPWVGYGPHGSSKVVGQ